jgi:hypothetical protein
MYCTSSLTGKNNYNKMTLYGNNIFHNECNIIPLEVQHIKIYILNNLIIPLISKQWDLLHENMFFVENSIKKIDYYSKMYKADDLIIYKELLKAIEIILYEHYQLEDLEKKIYTGTNNLASMIYKTSMIRLKPEYEIYDIILGAPNKNNNEKYNEIIINDIAHMLSLDGINFNKIKVYINATYININ